MTDEERAARREEIARKVRERVSATGNQAAVEFFNVMTDFMIDTEDRLEKIESRIDTVSSMAQSATARVGHVESLHTPLG